MTGRIVLGYSIKLNKQQSRYQSGFVSLILWDRLFEPALKQQDDVIYKAAEQATFIDIF
jgi:hypothetical protein